MTARPIVWSPLLSRLGPRGAGLLLLWTTALVAIVLRSDLLAMLGGLGLMAYVFSCIPILSGITRLFCMAAFVALVTLVWKAGSFTPLLAGLSQALVVAAFLPTLYLARAVAGSDPALLRYRTLFTAVPETDRGTWLLVGAFILGGILTAGSLAVLAPLVAKCKKGDARRRAALSAVCGAALSVLWSPLFIAMGVVTEFLPDVALWQLMGCGFLLGCLGLVLAMLLRDGSVQAAPVILAVRALAAIIWPVLAVVSAVAGLRALVGFGTLEAAVIVTPVAAALSLMRSRPGASTRASLVVVRGLNRMGEDICVLGLALTLGGTLYALPEILTPVTHWLTALDLAPLSLLSVLLFGSLLVIMAGLHPIVVTTTTLAVIAHASVPVSELALALVALLGWSLGAMIAYSGILIYAGISMFQVGRRDLIVSRNLLFVVLFAIMSLAIVTGLDGTFQP